ncbi:MAG: radical SAM protein [Candidatus Cloacimonetes bacterium]|nr:radical SAM protein [Candidatus Cloacimonadota bacterium]
MLDRFNRKINYLRISVTDKCNLRCTYCMPEEGVKHRKHDDFLSFEEIEKIVIESAKLGINKIRLTGGEPLVKRGIEELVRKIAKVDGIETVAMTTNGILLPQKAKALKEAGLSSVNISFDSFDARKYEKITRGGKLQDVLNGINSAIEEKITVKINMVVTEETSNEEIAEMQKFCDEKKIKLQLINHYSLVSEKKDDYVFDRPPNCANCNRIRLLTDGSLKPCLHSNEEIKVDLKDINGSLLRTVWVKPESGDSCTNRNMMEIGG